MRYSAYGNETLVRQRSQPLDVLASRDGERNGGRELVEQQLCVERPVFLERSQEGDDHDLLELRAAEAVSGGHDLGEVQVLGILLAQRQVDAQDRLALGGVGQVDEEDLVEAALAQQLRRQRGEVVGRRDDEYVRALLLQPREEGAEQAPAEPAVGVAVAAGRDALLDLVDPQDDWSHR